MIDYLNLVDQYQLIRESFLSRLDAALNANQFILGEKVDQFEENFSKYFHLPNCLGLSNGTDAIVLALEALNVGCGDEVIMNANTFASVGMAVCRSGAKSLFCDTNPETLQMDISSIEKLINKKTKCIIATHLFGSGCEILAIQTLCRRYELKLIEDCSQAHGLQIAGSPVGSFGDIGIFSCHPVKNLGAAGDAAVLCAQSRNVYDKIRIARNNGKTVIEDHQWGLNSRLDPVQAIFLNLKIKNGVFEKEIQTRRALSGIYFNELASCVFFPKQLDPVYHIFCVLLRDTQTRKIIMSHLKKHEIGYKIHYPIALYNQAWYKERFPDDQKKYQVYRSQDLQSRIISLPLHASLNQNDVMQVCNVVKGAFK